MAYISSTPRHCPGFAEFKNLKAFTCKCNNCGGGKEIFSDEFDRPHKCGKCGEMIDFKQCTLEAEGRSTAPE